MGPVPAMTFNNQISIETDQIALEEGNQNEEGNPYEERKAEMMF